MTNLKFIIHILFIIINSIVGVVFSLLFTIEFFTNKNIINLVVFGFIITFTLLQDRNINLKFYVDKKFEELKK